LAGTPATLSWSAPSLVLRLLDPARSTFLLPRNWLLGTNLQEFRLPAGLAVISVVASVITLALGLFLLLKATGWRIGEEQVPWSIAALVSLALLASPVSWSHYQIFQYPGVALLIIYLWRRRQWRDLIVALALAGFLHPAPIRFLDWVSHTPWRDSYFYPLYFWDTVPTIVTMVFFAAFVKRARPSALPHELRRPMPAPASYTPLPAATLRGHLHDGLPVASREVSNR
jgi:hypothetical protein